MEPGRSLEYQDDELINNIAPDATGNQRLVHATAPTQSQKLSSQNLVSMKKR